MCKIKTFKHIFLNSLFPERPYIKKAIKSPLKLSLKYFIALVLIVHILAGIISGIKKSAEYNFFADVYKDLNNSLNKYPDSMRIFIDNRQMISNFEKPYFFWITKKNIPHHLLVIDDSASSQDIWKYDASLLIGKTGVSLARYPNELTIGYPGTGVHVITKKHIKSYFDQIKPFLPVLPFLTVAYKTVLFLNIAFFTFFQKALFFAVLSIILYLILKFKLKKISYTDLLKIIIYSSTLPLCTEVLLKIITGMYYYNSHYLVSVLYVIFVVASVYQVYFKIR